MVDARLDGVSFDAQTVWPDEKIAQQFQPPTATADTGLKPAGETVVTGRGYPFAAGRILYADGHLYKVISDVGRGGTNGPSWQDEGFLETSRRLPALDPKLP